MYNMCFACGKDNPISLKLKFIPDDSQENGVTAEFQPTVEHQGYDGIVHGGIVSTLLDEAMVTAIINSGVEAVTAELNIRFKEETRVGERLKVAGYIKNQKSRLVFTEGVLKNEEGKVKAEAKAKFMVLK